MKRRFKFGVLFWGGIFFSNQAISQLNNLPLHTFYKEKFIENSGNTSIETFFPATENQLNLHHIIRDSSNQYFNFSLWLMKKNMLSVSRPEGNFAINPIIDFSVGKELTDTAGSFLFRNTRGAMIEGEISKRIAFSFLFAENQGRFMKYESDYFNSRGEIRDVGSTYVVENAVIPGSGRTKPFKVGAYDYAYSIGNVSFQLNAKIRFDVGNNQHFIGSGYRSLLLSDNSFAAPYLKMNWKINELFSYQILYRNQKNLYRKPATNLVEPGYESKFFGATYLTYKPRKNVAISLFTAGNQLVADSTIKHRISAQMWIPIPFIQNDLFLGNSAKINGISGLNLDFACSNMRFYGQFVVDKLNKSYAIGGQLGMHFFQIAKVKNLHAQAEMNLIPSHFYADQHAKLSYSNFNLPSAHPKGNNFHELIFRADYEFKRIFIQVKTIAYGTWNGNDSIPMSANSIFDYATSNKTMRSKTSLQEIQLGYRFNRKYNGMLFVEWKGRVYESDTFSTKQQMILVGLRTGFFNQYLDF